MKLTLVVSFQACLRLLLLLGEGGGGVQAFFEDIHQNSEFSPPNDECDARRYSTGAISLTVNDDGPPVEGNIWNATDDRSDRLVNSDQLQQLFTCETLLPDEHVGDTTYEAFEHPSVWYSIVGNGKGIRVTLCDVPLFDGSQPDTFGWALRVYRDHFGRKTFCEKLRCVAVSNIFEDTNMDGEVEVGVHAKKECRPVSFGTVQGSVYKIHVSDNSFNNAKFTISATDFDTAEGDVCENAIPLEPNHGDFSVTIDLETHTAVAAERCLLADGHFSFGRSRGIWHSVVGTGEVFQVFEPGCRSDSSGGVSVNVYFGFDCTGPFHCLDQEETVDLIPFCGEFYGSADAVTWYAAKDTTYYIVVETNVRVDESFTLHLRTLSSSSASSLSAGGTFFVTHLISGIVFGSLMFVM
jgi:hypothetical protein